MKDVTAYGVLAASISSSVRKYAALTEVGRRCMAPCWATGWTAEDRPSSVSLGCSLEVDADRNALEEPLPTSLLAFILLGASSARSTRSSACLTDSLAALAAFSVRRELLDVEEEALPAAAQKTSFSHQALHQGAF